MMKIYFMNLIGIQMNTQKFLCFTDIYLNIAFMIKESKGDDIEKLSLRGIAITPDEVKNSFKNSTLYNRSLILSDELKDEIIKSKEHIKSKVIIYLKMNA